MVSSGQACLLWVFPAGATGRWPGHWEAQWGEQAAWVVVAGTKRRNIQACQWWMWGEGVSK